jgi:CheY-like chemotaxis protein
MARKILLAEDDPNDVLLFEWALKRTGLSPELQVAASGQELMDLLAAYAAADQSAPAALPDVLFLDLKMPLVNGFEVLEWLGQRPEVRSLPVVVLSGSSMPADIHRATSLGARKYIEKPISADLLREILSSCARGL